MASELRSLSLESGGSTERGPEMSYEIGTIMSGPDLPSARSDFHNGAEPLATDAGASHVSGWQVISGSLAGHYGVITRWDSLDAAGNWIAETTEQAGPGGSTEQLLSRYQVVIRGMFDEVVEVGDPSGAYMMVSRFTMGPSPVGLDYAAQLPVDSGANGARITVGLSVGEWSGQLFGSTFYDSLDTLAAVLKRVGGDVRFMANAVASGAKLESRSVMRAL